MNYFDQASERLTFRKLSKEDSPAWAPFFIDNDSLRFLAMEVTKSPEAHASEWIEKQWERYEATGYGHLAAETKDTQEFVGMGGLIRRELNQRIEFEIAYSLLPAFWGKGYATEMAQQMKRFGSNHIETERFISIIHKENAASMRVAIKNGMRVLFETQFLDMEVQVYGVEKTPQLAME